MRQPRVAGQFYPASASLLKKMLEQLIEQKVKKETALGLVCPHAGYIYSGKIAACCFSNVKLTKTVIILGPNHTGVGATFSIMSQAATWQMPLGNVQVDHSLAKQILQQSRYLQEDLKAHIYEHSIEVQLPFLQYFLPAIKVVPIVVSDADFDVYDEIGQAIAKVLTKVKAACLIVASSDLTHYEPQQKAQKKDDLAIQSILKLDGKGLLKCIEEFNITMCGYGPVVCMLSATKALGAKTARLIKYQTSGEASGDYSSVVGYAGIMVK